MPVPFAETDGPGVVLPAGADAVEDVCVAILADAAAGACVVLLAGWADAAVRLAVVATTRLAETCAGRVVFWLETDWLSTDWKRVGDRAWVA